MVSEGVTNYSMLVLRMIALAFSVTTIPLVVTDNFKFEEEDDHSISHWKLLDYHKAFRYVVAVAAISAAYGIIQLPFAVYYAVKQKRLIPNGFFPDFDFFGDKVISLLLATAIGAGIGVSYEDKRSMEDILAEIDDPSDLDDPFISKKFNFLDRAITASSILAVACLCMAIVSVISSVNRSRSKGIFN